MKNAQKSQPVNHPHQPVAPEQCAITDLPTSITYSEEVIAELRHMIEEEKMAGDIYDVLYQQTGLKIFDRIATSEDRHLETLIAQAEQGGIDVDDLTLLPAGEYADGDMQALYATLLASASESTEAALLVGQQIEQVDIADLNEALADVAGTLLETAYNHLLIGSQHHLSAFEGWLGL